MCGRYTVSGTTSGEVRSRFPVGDAVEVRRRYNVAPGDDVLAVSVDRHGAPRGELLRWGLVPSWAQHPDVGLKMINARVESVAERPAFRRAYERFRCLIIADGFYEWRPVRKGAKQPFHITRIDRRPFAFAGLWSLWRGEDDSALRSCTILTTAANASVAALHDRMPVILDPDAEAAWLDPGTPIAELPELLRSLSAQQTALRPVDTMVNDARHDGPECLAAPPQDLQEALFH